MNTTDIKKALDWRYATKTFNAEKKISTEDWNLLEESLVLAPSSFGLQPWKFVIITDQALQEKLKPHSWNQEQVTTCSHYVVFCALNTVSKEYVDAFINSIAETRSVEASSLDGYKEMMNGFLSSMSPEAQSTWANKQTYIALGQSMHSAALLRIDSCPMEGISPKEYDSLLGLSGSNYHSVVACAFGYRSEDDKSQHAAKVRFSKDFLIERK